MNSSDRPPQRGEGALLQGQELHKSFTSGAGRIEVLRGINLAVSAGEMTAVVGASGSGKTTLLQVLGTLDSPDSGRLSFRGRDLTAVSENALSEHRNLNIGFIFQFHHLLPEFTALENVMMPGFIRGGDMKALAEQARELLEQVDLTARQSHRTGELSGGEQQRVALARALVMEPALLLADEPTGNLDSVNGRRVFSMLRKLSRERSLAVVMVTHNEELASAMDRRLTLKDGVLNG